MPQTTGEKTTGSRLGTSSSTMLDLAGSKLRKKLGSSLQESAAAPTSDFAYKQLQKMGWTEGTGLGKKRDGIKTHIRAIKRAEQAGIGTEKAAAEQRAAGESWWKDSLSDTLAKIGKKKKGSKKRKKEFTDEELFEATGGARFGMRAAPTKNLAKWRRAESDISETVTRKTASTVESGDGVVDQTEKKETSLKDTDDSSGKKERKAAKKAKDKKEKKKKKRKREIEA
jgi:Pin2-interacting protein X1